MKFKHMGLSVMAAATLSLSLALPGQARPAMLTATDPDSQINVRSAPTTQSAAPHYGVIGDRVEVLQALKDRQGYIWYYVRFNQSEAEGWVRGDFLMFF